MKTETEKTQQTHIRIPATLHKKLRMLAAVHGVTLQQVMNTCLVMGLKHLKDEK